MSVNGFFTRSTAPYCSCIFVKSIQYQLAAQTEFINIAAHELRTPIMPILTCVETLEAELGEKNEEVVMIKRNAMRLMRLAENVLSLTKIAGGNLNLKKEEFDLGSLLSEVLKDNDRRIAAKKCRLLSAMADDIYINADKDGIIRVFFNMLDNAIKFTSAGIISVTMQRADDEVVVSVSDSGPGIDPKVLPLLFTKFVTTSYKGTGLGLYISKEIVEAHGGRMWASNNTKYKKPGATFSFSLPLQDPEKPTTPL